MNLNPEVIALFAQNHAFPFSFLPFISSNSHVPRIKLKIANGIYDLQTFNFHILAIFLAEMQKYYVLCSVDNADKANYLIPR